MLQRGIGLGLEKEARGEIRPFAFYGGVATVIIHNSDYKGLSQSERTADRAILVPIAILQIIPMKNYRNEIICPVHKLPIFKIQQDSQRLLCAKCQTQSELEREKRLELLRAKLNAQYTQELNTLKAFKSEIQKTTDIFLSHNMVDAKRKIKKQLTEAQALVNKLVDSEVDEANRILKVFIDKLLKPWHGVDGRRFDLPYLQFEKAHPQILGQIEEKKAELKEKIGAKLKGEMRIFYTHLFGF